MNSVKISVIVPVYNAAATIEYTVGSILSPEFFEDCELILVDDASTDGSAGKCDSLADIHQRIRTVHFTKNCGVSAARNEGLRMARGEYVTFVDSDDLLPKNCLADWLGSISTGDADLYVGGYRLLNDSPVAPASEKGRLYRRGELSEFIDDNLSNDNSFQRTVWGKLFRKAILDESGLRFEQGLSYGEDMLFLFRFLLHCHNVETVPRCTYIYRIGTSGLSSDLCSDRQLMQSMLLIGSLSETIPALQKAFPRNLYVRQMYHRVLVGRHICRILTVFATRRTKLCTSDNISRLYHYMRLDPELNRCGGIFSLRPGQIPNLLLYRLSSPRFSAAFYKVSALICETLRIRPRHY